MLHGFSGVFISIFISIFILSQGFISPFKSFIDSSFVTRFVIALFNGQTEFSNEIEILNLKGEKKSTILNLSVVSSD